MSLTPFITAIVSIIVVGLIFTIIIGRNQADKSYGTNKRRTRNLLLIYAVATLLVIGAFISFLYNR